MIGATQMNFGDGNRNITPLSTASLFSSSTSYAVDDYCFYDGTLYRCTTAHSGVWNASHFTAVTIADELADVKSDLSEIISGGGGVTDALKLALLQIAQKVAYIDDDGQDYYDALYDALYPTATLDSISAIYTQGGVIYTDNTLDDLKPDLVVTGHWSDSTTTTISTGYTLSGSLTAGTSTITVSYSGLSTTFTVNVTAIPYPLENGSHTFTNYPQSIVVSEGKRALVTLAQGNNKDIHANLSKVSDNGTECNVTSNYTAGGTTYFTIPAGSTLSAKATINAVEKGTNTCHGALAFRNLSGSAVLIVFNTAYLKDMTVGQEFTQSVTVEADTDIGCVGFYLGNRQSTPLASLDLTIEAYIDGTRII